MSRRKRSIWDQLLSGRWDARRKATTTRRRTAKRTAATRKKKRAAKAKGVPTRPRWTPGAWEQYRCEFCGASPGKRCTTAAGKPAAQAHTARVHAKVAARGVG